MSSSFSILSCRFLSLVSLLGCLLQVTLGGQEYRAQWTDTPKEASAGYFTLKWLPPDGHPVGQAVEFELQESSTSDFKEPVTVYRGQDRASTLSGKKDSRLFYRVRAISPMGAEPGEWSPVAEVRVTHHSLTRAFIYLGVGFVVFATALGIILGGNSAHRKESA